MTAYADPSYVVGYYTTVNPPVDLTWEGESSYSAPSATGLSFSFAAAAYFPPDSNAVNATWVGAAEYTPPSSSAVNHVEGGVPVLDPILTYAEAATMLAAPSATSMVITAGTVTMPTMMGDPSAVGQLLIWGSATAPTPLGAPEVFSIVFEAYIDVPSILSGPDITAAVTVQAYGSAPTMLGEPMAISTYVGEFYSSVPTMLQAPSVLSATVYGTATGAIVLRPPFVEGDVVLQSRLAIPTILEGAAVVLQPQSYAFNPEIPPETLFDGGSTRFITPAIKYGDGNQHDKYVVFSKETIIG